MAKVKVPGKDREIEFDLHEPVGPDVPWFVSVGTEVKLTPEQFAEAMADPNSGWKFPCAHEITRQVTPVEADEMRASARRFEPLRREATARQRGPGRGGRGRGGHPHVTFFSVSEDIAVLATHFMQRGLKRQAAIDQAADYWIDNSPSRKQPAQRLIDAAMARLRRGGITGLDWSVEVIRDKYALPNFPIVVKRKTGQSRIK